MRLATSEADFEASQERTNEILFENGNPGRWLGIGTAGEGEYKKFYLASSFGGRSDRSKRRTAIMDGSAVRIVAPGMTIAEMNKNPHAALNYYVSSDTRQGVFAVSNGAQTRPILDLMVSGASFEEAVTNAPVVPGLIDGEEQDIDLSSYEPDPPINTPRITGVLDLRPGAATPFGLAVVSKDLETGGPDRKFYTADLDDLRPNEAWAIQTYGVNDPDDNDAPVPHFDQEPYGIQILGDSAYIAQRVKAAIGERTFSGAVVRVIDIESRDFAGNTIINTHG